MQFSKQEILSLYLNKVYLGNAEGIEAASQGYFGKHAIELNLAESALLVGILPAPSRYAPHVNPEFAMLRRNIVNISDGFTIRDGLSSSSILPFFQVLILFHSSIPEDSPIFTETILSLTLFTVPSAIFPINIESIFTACWM